MVLWWLGAEVKFPYKGQGFHGLRVPLAQEEESSGVSYHHD